jgi:zinc-binding alcohol dehydrogenase family protein
MKAVVYRRPLPIEHDESLIDVEMERPSPGPRDLLVSVKAISVNPVDTKIRGGGGPIRLGDEDKILGWDAAGIVASVGSEVTLFKAGDEVFYMGAVERSGSYAEFQLVDERLVGRRPLSVGFEEAAALPLTALTAWEMLFERMKIPEGASEGSVLILGAAGGVGSIATQLVRALTGLTVIATASRPKTREWAATMGAHHVIDHRQPLAPQVKAIVPGGVDYVFALTKVEEHFDDLLEAMAPQSALGLIENPATPLDIIKMKAKSISLFWEFVFTRSRYQTRDMARQGEILNRLADLVEAGKIRSTLHTDLGAICAANLKKAHALVESGTAVGKVGLCGF